MNRLLSTKRARKNKRPLLQIERLEDRTMPSAYMVTTTKDTGGGSLRDAITQINGDTSHTLYASPSNSSVDEIDFAITAASDTGGGFNSGSGVATFTPSSALPTITNAVIIDGTTQPGFVKSPLIELNGSGAGSGANGLNITAGNTRVRGLVIDQFGQNGILLSGGGGDVIAGNYIGTDVGGALSQGNGHSGVMVLSSGNTVGGTGSLDGNVLSGNKGTRNSLPQADGGVSIDSANNNVVEGNFVGINAAGTGALANSGFGVVVIGTCTGNTIGGTAAGARNVVSGNLRSGIGLGVGPTFNSVVGNYVGTDVTGTIAIGNRVSGILVQFDGDNNTIQGNVVSGNAIGVNIIDANNNVVQGNFIGTNAAGTAALGNVGNSSGFGPGVSIYAQASYTATGNLIGGTTAATRNIISANKAGVWMQGAATTNNTVEGNYIGTDITGTVTLGNTGPGVEITTVFAGATGANNNAIGGTATGAGNLITGNGGAGILLTNFNSIVNTTGSGVVNNLLVGNSIYGNNGLGIDLGGDGVTANTPGGPHVGPNDFQNYPVLSSATTGTGLLVSGTLNSAANTTFTIEVFANQTADPSGHGPGQYDLGTTSVTTDASGNATFTTDFSTAAAPGGVVPAGWAISATATDPNHNTSEFSADVTAAAASAQTFAQSLQSALPAAQNPTAPTAISVQTGPDLTQDTVISAVNGLTSPSVPVTITLNLNGGTYNDTTVSPPANVTLIIDGSNGTNTFVGHSPAFIVTGGNVIVRNVTFLTDTDAPTILVSGGSLTLRNDIVQESSGYTDAAISITGGTLDLGTAASPGGNTLNVNGLGEFVHNTTANLISAVGDTFSINGTPQSATTLSFTSLAASAATALLNQPVTFTATVLPNGAGTPSASVDFVDTTTNTDLGSVTLSGGTAALTTSALSTGNHVIQARYSGDGIFLSSLDSIAVSVQCKFSGFLAPLKDNLTLALNRTVPIKFQLTDANGNFISSLNPISSLQVLDGTSKNVLTNAGSTALRYDSTANQFIANWQTKGLAAGTYTITLVLADGTTSTKAVTLSKAGGSAGLTTTTAGGTSAGPGGLLGGNIELYVDNGNGDLTADELARIQDAVTAADAITEPYGVAVQEVTDPTLADVTLNMDTTSAVGGYAAGVLGCTTDAGQITLIQGWNFYAGSDATQIGSGQYDFETVVTHELGHALGLGHSTDSTSVMYATLNTGSVNRSLTAADLNVPDTSTTGACGLHAAVGDVGRISNPSYEAASDLLFAFVAAQPNGLPVGAQQLSRSGEPGRTSASDAPSPALAWLDARNIDPIFAASPPREDDAAPFDVPLFPDADQDAPPDAMYLAEGTANVE